LTPKATADPLFSKSRCIRFVPGDRIQKDRDKGSYRVGEETPEAAEIVRLFQQSRPPTGLGQLFIAEMDAYWFSFSRDGWEQKYYDVYHPANPGAWFTFFRSATAILDQRIRAEEKHSASRHPQRKSD